MYNSALFKGSESFSFFCCLINMNDRQQEYSTGVTLRAAWMQYTVTHVFFTSCLLSLKTYCVVFTRILARMGILTDTSVCI